MTSRSKFLPYQQLIHTATFSLFLSLTPIKVRKRDFSMSHKMFFLDSAKTDIRSERENLFFFSQTFFRIFLYFLGDAICTLAIFYTCCYTHLFIYNIMFCRREIYHRITPELKSKKRVRVNKILQGKSIKNRDIFEIFFNFIF